jgi:hypothetical protein
MNELIINNRRVDLGENTNIGLNFSANNIGELQNRQGNFTNTFKLPNSKNNKEIFEWSHLQTTSSLMPYKKLKATYLQNGIEIVSDGIAELQSTDNDYFYLNVYSGNLDFMGAIGEATIGDLYKNDIVYNWSTYYVINRRYVYDYIFFPIIDWREDLDFFLTNTIDVRQMLPCATMPQLFNRLSTYTGFTFVGNYLNNVEHTTMMLTPNEFTIPSSSAIKTSQKLQTKALGQYEFTDISTGTSIGYVKFFPEFRNESKIVDFNIGAFKPTVNKVGKLRFAGNYQCFKQSGGKVKDYYLNVSIIDENEVDVYGPIKYGPYKEGYTEIPIDIETSEMTFLSTKNYKAKINAEIYQTNKNTKFQLYEYDKINYIQYVNVLVLVNGIPTGATQTKINSPIDTLPHYLQFTPSPKIAFNNALDFTKIFTMKIKDVIKDILNLRGIIIQTNNYTKTISFNSFEDVNLNKSVAKNWSEKIQNSTSMSFKFGNYAKKNNFLFKEDTDRVNNADNYHNYTVYLNNETLDDEKTVVKLAHPTTIITGRYNGFNVPTINGLKDATNEWKKSDWRILNTKVQNTNFNVNYTDGTTTTAINTYLPFCDIIGFETLVPKYYSTIKNILENPKVLKIVAKLDVTDISDLDFSIPIQIQRPDLNISGYFYINKIENYKGGLTSCEIIEI